MSFDLKIVKGDLSIGSDGDLKKVENTDKLIQDILKIIQTPLGANIFFPAYGSLFSKAVIGNNLPFEFTSSMAEGQIKSSLEVIQKLQRLQEQQGQKISPSELLAAVKTIKIERNQIDPRYIGIFVSVLSKALTVVDTAFEVAEI